MYNLNAVFLRNIGLFIIRKSDRNVLQFWLNISTLLSTSVSKYHVINYMYDEKSPVILFLTATSGALVFKLKVNVLHCERYYNVLELCNLKVFRALFNR